MILICQANSMLKVLTGVSGFFLLTTIFIIAVSILVAYTTIFATECSKKDDLQISSLGHLIKSLDWFNGYN
jgi:hypothetical protein